MSEPEKLTIDDIMVMDQQNFDPIIAVWTEMAATDQTVTLLKATIEWARRQGRIIEVVPTKMAASADQSYTIAASDATGTVTKPRIIPPSFATPLVVSDSMRLTSRTACGSTFAVF